jgi:hypothetical protein
MTTGNHLTVRDYFDQVLVGRTLNKRTNSSQRAGTSGNRSFHQLLTSLGNQQFNDKNNKPAGLTVVDYLSNPVRIKCHFNYRKMAAPSEKNEAAIEKAATASANRLGKDPGDTTVEGSRSKRKPMQLMNPTASTSPPDQTGPNQKRVIERSIHKAAQKYNLPADLIRGVIRAESNFEVKAVSRAGARGLMQLMPGTAKELGVDNPFDIAQNIDGGARYLRKMLDSFGGDIKVALAAYNAGPGAVAKYGGNVPPYQETERYINRVLKFSKQIA